MTYNPDIHHRRSIRLKEYNYSAAGAYFVTFCAFQRECLFGNVVDSEMLVNPYGEIVRECWQRMPAHFPYVEIDEFVVMPNHFHAILLINESVGAKQSASASPLPHIRESFSLQQGTLPGSLGAILQNFKSVSTRKSNKLRENPGCPIWQRNYYERVIRDEKELSTAREYIMNNPIQWDLDKNNPKNIIQP
jgi:REP element-mobilizing transposase RayT